MLVRNTALDVPEGLFKGAHAAGVPQGFRPQLELLHSLASQGRSKNRTDQLLLACSLRERKLLNFLENAAFNVPMLP